MHFLPQAYHEAILWALYIASGMFLANLAIFRRLKAAQPDQEMPLVSILIPARNEARNIETCVQSLLNQDYPYCEVIVLDDSSEDETVRIVESLGVREGGAISRLIRGAPLPAGWSGKSWACHQLSQAARGEYFFFTDADTEHDLGAVSALLAFAKENDADLVSAWPRLVTQSWSEKLVLPLLPFLAITVGPYWLITLLQRFPAVARHLPEKWLRSLGTANGQSLFFRRGSYGAIGGHAAIRGHLVEDIALGRAVAGRTGSGMRVINCDAGEFSRCRMYRSFPEVWSGFTKNIWAVFDGSLIAFVIAGLVQFACFTLPCLSFFAHPGASSLVAKEALLIYALRAAATVRFGTSWLGAALHPFGCLLSLCIALNSLRESAGAGVRWKGRLYPGATGTAPKQADLKPPTARLN